MARHLTAQGITDPCAVTKAELNRYLLAQYRDRKPGGKVALYQAVRHFFDWLAAEYQVPNPIAGIPRPKGASAPVPVVKPEQVGGILAPCRSKNAAVAARNTAVIWLLIESGLRHFKVTKLDLADVDLKACPVTVRRGKGGKARVVVFGNETAQAICATCGSAAGMTARCSSPPRAAGSRPAACPSSWPVSPGGPASRSDRACSGTPGRTTASPTASASPTLWNWPGWSDPSMLRWYGAALARERALAAGRAIQVGHLMRAR